MHPEIKKFWESSGYKIVSYFVNKNYDFFDIE